MTLTLLGVASMIFSVWFTVRSWRAGSNQRAAIIEALTNLGIGFSINFVANLFILPLAFDMHITHSTNWWLGWIYTSISIIRQYSIRMYFQDRIHRAAQRLANT